MEVALLEPDEAIWHHAHKACSVGVVDWAMSRGEKTMLHNACMHSPTKNTRNTNTSHLANSPRIGQKEHTWPTVRSLGVPRSTRNVAQKSCSRSADNMPNKPLSGTFTFWRTTGAFFSCNRACSCLRLSPVSANNNKKKHTPDMKNTTEEDPIQHFLTYHSNRAFSKAISGLLGPTILVPAQS
jgi:hypothetical protein